MGRILILCLALILAALTSVGIFLDRKSDCHRLAQTAELAMGSEIRGTFFGGCRVITLSQSQVRTVPLDGRPAGTSGVNPNIEKAASQVETVSPGAASTKTIGQVITQEQIDGQRSPQLAQCLATGDALKGVSVAMGGCVNTELEAQDARLNATYQDVMRQLNAAGKTRLRWEQRSWMQRRDDECVEQATGGTIDLVDVPACRLDHTIRQRLVLETLAP